MLKSIHIRNMALIRDLTVDFSDGLNILTGETGAGKSVLIDAVALGLGGKTSRSHSFGEKTALIELTFSIENESVERRLKDLAIEPEDGEILISRSISDGKSRLRINGEARTLKDVREASSLLLDIHGQSEHQKLLLPKIQLDLLDEFGKEPVAKAKEAYAKAFAAWKAAAAAMGGEDLSPEERARKADLLGYEISQIEEVSPKPGEDAELEAEFKRLSNAQETAEALGGAIALAGYDAPGAAGESVGEAVRLLSRAAAFDPAVAELSSSLSEAEAILGDFVRSASDYLEGLELSGETYAKCESRLNAINKLKMRYGQDLGGILKLLEEKKAELAELEDYEDRRRELAAKLLEAENELQKAADLLTKARVAAAEDFSAAVAESLQELNFAKADFAVSFSKKKEKTGDGQDAAEFMISTNPGQDRRPLKDVVSGGELSRIMLGIRTMFASDEPTGTLIFDEVDAGISGVTAQRVASKLIALSKERQVLCITHLPQIAAAADHHFLIEKSVNEEEAVTGIAELDGEGSVREVARLMGGDSMTDAVLKAAAELKAKARA